MSHYEVSSKTEIQQKSRKKISCFTRPQAADGGHCAVPHSLSHEVADNSPWKFVLHTAAEPAARAQLVALRPHTPSFRRKFADTDVNFSLSCKTPLDAACSGDRGVSRENLK